MSHQQYMNLLQREVNAGGCGGPAGGLFTPQSRAALSAYQQFRAMHPGMPRAQLSAMWHAHKTGGSMGGRLGGALLGGFPGQRQVYAAIDAREINKQNRKIDKRAARAQYDAANPGWKAQRALYVPQRPRAPARSKAASALYKQMRALSMANPVCVPFGLSAVERADYNKLREVADYLDIPRSPLDVQHAQLAAKRAAKKAAKRAAEAELLGNPVFNDSAYIQQELGIA